jgi:hypothetical protein
MTTTPEVLDLHAVPHPSAPVRQAGFPLDHPYLEHCWTPVLGPSTVLLLRRCPWLWREGMPAHVATEDLASQLGLGRGTGRTSAISHTIDRVVRFRFAAMPTAGELHVYTEVPPLPTRLLERLPGWCRDEHERLLGTHLDALARSVSSAPRTPPEAVSPSHVRMAQRLGRLAGQPPAISQSLSR